MKDYSEDLIKDYDLIEKVDSGEYPTDLAKVHNNDKEKIKKAILI